MGVWKHVTLYEIDIRRICIGRKSTQNAIPNMRGDSGSIVHRGVLTKENYYPGAVPDFTGSGPLTIGLKCVGARCKYAKVLI